jgi:predicted RNA-binding protein YlxR (DUF448 family)
VRLAVHDGDLVVDRHRRLGGRGAYVHPRARCVERAVKRGALARRLRATVAVPDELGERIGVEAASTAWKN